MNTSHPRRRALLAGTLLAAGTAALPRAWAQALPVARGQGRLVVVFLRGALDGLSAFVPWSDPDYARLRPGIAIPPPDGSGQSTIRLDGSFGLHPALAMLEPLWREQVLAFVPAAGSPDGTRSHFDAQYQWETARPGQSGDAPGWLNLLAAQLGGAGGDAQPRILGVGEANPRLLAGREPVQLVAHGKAAQRAGALENPRQPEAAKPRSPQRDRGAKDFGGKDQRREATLARWSTKEPRRDDAAGKDGEKRQGDERRSRASNVWMAPGARPSGPKAAASAAAKTPMADPNKRFGKKAGQKDAVSGKKSGKPSGKPAGKPGPKTARPGPRQGGRPDAGRRR